MRLYTKNQLVTKMSNKPTMDIKNNTLTVTLEYGWSELRRKHLIDVIRFCKMFNIKLHIVSWDDILAHDTLIDALFTYSNITMELKASGLKRHPSYKRMRMSYTKLNSIFGHRVTFKIKAISGYSHGKFEAYIRLLKCA